MIAARPIVSETPKSPDMADTRAGCASFEIRRKLEFDKKVQVGGISHGVRKIAVKRDLGHRESTSRSASGVRAAPSKSVGKKDYSCTGREIPMLLRISSTAVFFPENESSAICSVVCRPWSAQIIRAKRCRSFVNASPVILYAK